MTATPGRLVLLGHPVAHSLSPVFQNAALAAANIPLRYEAMDVPAEGLSRTFDQLRADRAAGNVTVPHKEAVQALCDELTPIAQRTGAVNCFALRDGAMIGHNTDVDGVRKAVHRLLGRDPADLTIGVIGAGGAAAAVLTAAEGWTGCRALVINRDQERLRRLTARFSSVARPSDAGEIADRADLVVNATSLGLHDADPLPIEPRLLGNDAAVLDLVYAPDQTRLVRAARARNLRAQDGLRMLVYQGAAAFEWWFGFSPDRDVMWQSVAPRPDETLD